MTMKICQKFQIDKSWGKGGENASVRNKVSAENNIFDKVPVFLCLSE